MTDVFVGRCKCKLSGDLCAVYPDHDPTDPPVEVCKHGWRHTVYIDEFPSFADGMARVYRDVMWKPISGSVT